jgi:chemotaxis methyl-accepting protein methylase
MWKPSPFRLFTKRILSFTKVCSTRPSRFWTIWLSKTEEPISLTVLREKKTMNIYSIGSLPTRTLYSDQLSEK